MRLITKQAAKLEELEARRERIVNRIAKLDLKIEEQKEKIAQYYRKQGINEQNTYEYPKHCIFWLPGWFGCRSTLHYIYTYKSPKKARDSNR